MTEEIITSPQNVAEIRSIDELLLEIFGGNPYFAVASESGGDWMYSPVERELTADDLKNHLDGRLTLGCYQLSSSSSAVKWFGWDVDSLDNMGKAREEVVKILKELSDIPHCVEFSGRKGYHILVFLTEEIPASTAKTITESIREKLGLQISGKTHVECYPKQEKLMKSKPKGNLLKIPLGRHPRSREFSAFVDPDNGWENGDCLNPLEILTNKATPHQIKKLLGDENSDPIDSISALMSQYWTEGKRHDLSLFLSGFLINEGWGVDQTKDLLEKICVLANDDHLTNRHQTVETTYLRHKEGKSVRGRQGLGEILPLVAMQQLTQLIALVRTPDTVSQIDDIRYTKGRPMIESCRLASNTMWSILTDNGCDIIQTINKTAFWYNSETHLMIEEGTEVWRALLNQKFGLNPLDGFSKMAAQELRLRIVRDSPLVDVHQRAHWDDDSRRLFMNLGGPEVYILDGQTIETSYNGECCKLFETKENGEFIMPDFESPPLDVWDFLVNDVSFKKSEDATASPEQQKELLKAWLLSFFFQEIMPTKPILAILGIQGSGKTTTMRRILKLFEGFEEDVLSVQGDKQDSLRASLSYHKLLVLDNLEKSGVWWLIDFLNRLSTGSNIELRQLYKTNERFTIVPKCFVACTAVAMPFSDETLFTRLLILETQQIQEQLPEYLMQKKLVDNCSRLWADILRKLNMVVRSIRRNVTVKPPSKSRLVDFTVFCSRIQDSGALEGSNLMSGIESLTSTQMKQLKESSQAIALLADWIRLRPQEAAMWHDINEIFVVLQTMSGVRKINLKWRNAIALWRHLDVLQNTLKIDMNAEFDNLATGKGDFTTTRIRFKNIGMTLPPAGTISLDR